MFAESIMVKGITASALVTVLSLFTGCTKAADPESTSTKKDKWISQLSIASKGPQHPPGPRPGSLPSGVKSGFEGGAVTPPPKGGGKAGGGCKPGPCLTADH